MGVSLIKQPMCGNFLKTHFAISLEFFFQNVSLQTQGLTYL